MVELSNGVDSEKYSARRMIPDEIRIVLQAPTFESESQNLSRAIETIWRGGRDIKSRAPPLQGGVHREKIGNFPRPSPPPSRPATTWHFFFAPPSPTLSRD